MTNDNGVAWYPVLKGVGDIDEATGALKNVQLDTSYTDVLPRVGEYVTLRVYESPRNLMDDVDVRMRVTSIEHRARRRNVGGVWVVLEPLDDTQRQRAIEGLRLLAEQENQ